MTDILMPRLSDTMTEGAIARWHKQPGDRVHPGDVLVEIETDKALMEQEAYDEGTLTEILVPEGENVAIGTPIARLDMGAAAASAAPAQPAPTAEARTADPDAQEHGEPPQAPPASAPEQAPASIPAPTEHGTRPGAATPLVRKLARERGLDLADVRGTGPGGRIIRADLDELLVAPPEDQRAIRPTDDARDPRAVPFDAIRQQIAARLTASGTTVPTFTVTTRADVSELMALRAQLNTATVGVAAGTRISVNDLLVRATAQALRAHPGVNASYEDDGGRGRTLMHGRVHIGIAVASPGGLVVPVIPDTDRAAVSVIAATSRSLIAKANDRTLGTAEMTGGTFTISNLGMYGVEQFTAIINPPQGAILAVGGIHEEVALLDGTVTVRRAMRFTLTADHRIIDGALAAQFLATLRDLVEHPLRILA